MFNMPIKGRSQKNGLVAVTGITLLLLATAVSSASGKVLHAWTQIIDANNMSIRAIVAGKANCPSVSTKGKKSPMSVRAKPEAGSPGQFPNTVCEYNLPRDNKNRTVGGLTVPGVADDIANVAVMGDTGCRLSQWVKHEQACNNIQQWPAKAVADTVAAEKPDMVIHVGDYLYREAPCTKPKLCGKVWGYNWPAWNADWFQPSADLRSTRAFLFTRGNHEACGRAWRGWFRYMAPGKYQQGTSCVDRSPPFAVKLGKFRAVMYDTSDIGYNSKVPPDFSNIPADKPKLPTWFVTHRPFWAAYNARPYNDYSYGGDTVMKKAFQSANQSLKDSTKVLISGHVHYAQTIAPPNWPLQIIVGNSGTALNLYGKPYDYTGTGITAKDVINVPGFGYAMIDVASGEVVFKGIHGTPVARTSFK